MKVTSLHVYPLKSGQGLSIGSRRAEERGFEGDRRFMVTDPAGNFFTQRTHPQLGWVSVSGSDTRWRFEADGSAVEIDPMSGERVDTQVWDDPVRALDCGEDAAVWFSKLLETPARLVYMPDDAHRPSSAPHPGDDIALSFADSCPYLIATTASLADLNSRIPGDDVPMRAFRPSIVVSETDAWAEDAWREIAIGDARFEAVKPCTRCKIVTLEPDRPQHRGRRDGEPLRTLAGFRRDARGEVMFGVYFVCRTPGVVISAFDTVTVISA